MKPFSMRKALSASIPYAPPPNDFALSSKSLNKLSPYRAGTAISYACSPEKEIRNKRPETPPNSTPVHPIYDKFSSFICLLRTELSNSRDFGPATANCAQCSVTDTKLRSKSGRKT